LNPKERETGIEPATSSLGIHSSFDSKEDMRRKRLSCSIAHTAFQQLTRFVGLMQ
jgi:hypothetical protein